MFKVLILLLICLVAVSEQSAHNKLALGNNLFAIDVYKKLTNADDNKDNLLICPFSAETILALAQSGAKDHTAREMRKALHLSKTPESLFKTVLPSLKKRKSTFGLFSANKIYVTDEYPIKKDFKRVAENVYLSSVENVNFTEPKVTAETINTWVEEKTERKIKNLIEASSLSDRTVAVLINALYFKAAWNKSFKKYATVKKDFYKNDDQVDKVETMQTRGFHDYYESAKFNAKFLKLPFKSHGNAYMVVVLPNDQNGLTQIESQMDKHFFKPNFTSQYVNIALPKFRIEVTVDLKEILIDLGVKKAFSDADFSGIAGEKGQIQIDKILQKSFLSVDEDGVEAAAATSINFYAKSLIEYLGEKKYFIADHPFLFYVKIKNIVIFVGRVISPV